MQCLDKLHVSMGSHEMLSRRHLRSLQSKGRRAPPLLLICGWGRPSDLKLKNDLAKKLRATYVVRERTPLLDSIRIRGSEFLKTSPTRRKGSQAQKNDKSQDEVGSKRFFFDFLMT